MLYIIFLLPATEPYLTNGAILIDLKRRWVAVGWKHRDHEDLVSVHEDLVSEHPLRAKWHGQYVTEGRSTGKGNRERKERCNGGKPVCMYKQDRKLYAESTRTLFPIYSALDI